MIFTRRGIIIDNYPSVKKHLMGFYDQLLPKPRNHTGEWYGRKEGNYKWFEIQDSVDYYEEFDKPKIYFPGMSSDVTAFTFDDKGLYGNDNAQMIISDDKYLLGVLNSKVSHFFLSRICDFVRGGFARLKISYVKQIPIPPADAAEQLAIAELVETILSKKQADAQANTSAEERAIDVLVYALFRIDDADEIGLIEEK